MSTTWEDVEIPQGTFIGWGKKGQTITGKVLTYSGDGGSDFAGNPCPQVVLELTEDADNYKDKGTTHEVIKAGEFATVTCGQANLKRAIVAAQITPGDLVRMIFEDTYKTANGEGKSFKVQVARGAGRQSNDDDLI